MRTESVRSLQGEIGAKIMNLVVLIGNLTSDPKLSYTPNTSTPVASFRLAVKKPTKDGGADFIQCKVFGRQAETLAQYKFKGDEIAVQGRIDTSNYKDRDGKTVYVTEVVCERIEYTRTPKRGNEETPQRNIPQGDSRQGYESVSPSYTQQSFTDLPNFDDLPDTFSAAEDDIPF